MSRTQDAELIQQLSLRLCHMVDLQRDHTRLQCELSDLRVANAQLKRERDEAVGAAESLTHTLDESTRRLQELEHQYDALEEQLAKREASPAERESVPVVHVVGLAAALQKEAEGLSEAAERAMGGARKSLYGAADVLKDAAERVRGLVSMAHGVPKPGDQVRLTHGDDDGWLYRVTELDLYVRAESDGGRRTVAALWPTRIELVPKKEPSDG